MYADLAKMIGRFGEDEVIALSDRASVGSVDESIVDDMLSDASSEIDTYLAGRYALPLDPVPTVLAGVCCDIARYLMCGSSARMTEDVESRYKRATGFLKLVARGEVTIGVSAAGTVTPSDNPVVIVTSRRVFGREDR